MIVILCAKYKKNPSRTVDATERTRFSKSRSNDLEDIGQGQRSWCATHTLMVVIVCAYYEKNPSITVDVTERTRHAGRTDGRTDGWSETSIPPKQLPCIIKHESSASMAFVWGIHWWLVNSLHKKAVTWKMFPFDDVIMIRDYAKL